MSLVSDAWGIARAAVRSADPGRAVARELRRAGNVLRVGGRRLPMASGARVDLVAIGKAAGPMLDVATRRVGPAARGLAFTPRGYPPPRSGPSVVYGDHPVPGPASFAAGRRLLDHVRSLPPDDLVIFLLSGGGSATVEVPAPRVRSSDVARTTRLLLGSGAPIGGMNAVRRHLSLLKGGQLAASLTARRFATLAISDVVGDAPEDIASGPTVADPTTFRDALEVLRRYRLTGQVPHRVLERLRAGTRGELDETPKPGDPRLAAGRFTLVATNQGAVRAARAEASRRGFRTRVVAHPLVGETRPVAVTFARELLSARIPLRPRAPLALLAGGETTVTLGPRPGRGGRNGEFALAAAERLRGRNAVILSVGTDGVDGPTDAAGGWVDGTSFDRAVRLGLDVRGALAGHASYDLLDRLGGLVRTGPTGTNVMDVHVGLLLPSAARPRGRRPRAPILQAEVLSRDRAGSSRRRAVPTSRRRRS